jgi:NAD(P)-dependent dehydrogenase (short-subunit alcohol dehydrogenase family)
MARWNADAIPSLKGKRAIVTGANGGLGYFTALELARHGAQVTMACRSSARAEAAADKIRAAAPAISIPSASLRRSSRPGIAGSTFSVTTPVWWHSHWRGPGRASSFRWAPITSGRLC